MCNLISKGNSFKCSLSVHHYKKYGHGWTTQVKKQLSPKLRSWKIKYFPFFKGVSIVVIGVYYNETYLFILYHLLFWLCNRLKDHSSQKTSWYISLNIGFSVENRPCMWLDKNSSISLDLRMLGGDINMEWQRVNEFMLPINSKLYLL